MGTTRGNNFELTFFFRFFLICLIKGRSWDSSEFKGRGYRKTTEKGDEECGRVLGEVAVRILKRSSSYEGGKQNTFKNGEGCE